MNGIAELRVPGRVLNAAAAGQWTSQEEFVLAGHIATADDLKTHGLAVGGGVRRVNLASLYDPKSTPFPVSLTYLVIGPEKAFPTTVRVPRKSRLE